jgi:hypothetical protein
MYIILHGLWKIQVDHMGNTSMIQKLSNEKVLTMFVNIILQLYLIYDYNMRRYL